MKARQSASTVKSTGRVHRMGRNHKSCFVLNFLPSKIKQGIHAKPNSPMKKRLNLWLGHESVADTLLLQMRTPASENEEWQGKKAKRHMWHPSPHLRSTACTHPASQSEGKNECGAPNTLRSCNENMLKVWISHARYLSQTLQRHIRWAAPHFPPDIMEIHFMDITH